MKTINNRNTVIERLKKEIATDKPKPLIIESGLSYHELHELPSLFQPRKGLDMHHLNSLANAIKNEPSKTLDPLEIWWSGERFYVLDGHHRYTAYGLFEKNQKERNPQWALPLIPVDVFEGSLEEAIAKATFLNTKDKLIMTKSEKLNRAWLIVALKGSMSKEETASTCKVSTSTIGEMRRRNKEIHALWPENHPETPSLKDCNEWCISATWQEAKQFGKQLREYDDDWENREALKLAERFGKAFGKINPEATRRFAKAFMIYSPTFAEGLQDALSNELGIDVAIRRREFKEVFGVDDYIEFEQDYDF